MDLPERKPMRLKEYDYSTPGAYFITICTRERECILSRILVGAGVLDGPRVELSSCGIAVEEIKLAALEDVIARFRGVKA